MLSALAPRHSATVITMLRIARLGSALCLLTACAAEPPVEPSLPLPPQPPPSRVRVQRVAPRPQLPPAVAEDAADDAGAASHPVPAVAAEPVWRVARDGVVGCADRAALGVLNQAAESAPRLLAEARAAGGCRTTFRVNEWVVLATEPDAVRLRLTNGAPLTLWFRRSELIAP